MKKFFASLIILTLIISSFGIVAFADETPAFTITYSDGTKSATANTFADAATIANAKTDGTLVTITMNKDSSDATNYYYPDSTPSNTSESKATFVEGTNVVLDLNGYTLKRNGTTSNKSTIVVFGGKLEIKNGTINQTQTGSYAVWASPHAANKTEVVINNATIKSADGCITTSYSNTVNGGAEVTIKGNSVIESGGTALYAIKKNCVINVESGLITSSVAESSSVTKGKIFQIQAPSSMNISGGTFKNTTYPNPVDMYDIGGGKTTGTVTITGGTFPVDPSVHCPDGYYANKISSNEYVVERTTVAIKENAVSNRKSTSTTSITSGFNYETDNVSYKTLAYAVADDVNDTDVDSSFVAPQSTVIKLMADNNEEIEISKELTITKNGFEAANLSAGAGYTLNETDTAYIVTKVNEVEEALGATYEDGNGAKTARFFAPIDSKNYAEAGFEITTTIDEITYSWIIKLYEIYSNVVVNNATYGAENYIFTGAIGEIPTDINTTLTVTPYTMNFEGEKTYGNAFTVTVE